MREVDPGRVRIPSSVMNRIYSRQGAWLCLLFALAIAPRAASPPLAESPYLALVPMLGHVASDEARIWCAASTNAVLGVLIGTTENLDGSKVVEGPKVGEESAFMGHVRVTGLLPVTRYFYCVTLNGKPALFPPFPSFTTAPPEGEPGRLRFGFASCVGFHGYLATAGYADMARTNMDLLLMIGDNTYANTNDPVVQRRYYFDQRRTSGWRGLAPEMPIYAIWDDHDFGPNDADGRMPGKEKSLKTFQEVWANPAYGEPDNPAVYFKFRRRDVEFFMLDGRYYRDPNKATNIAHKTMLGEKQLAWLKRELPASKASIKVLVSGGEWQTHGTEDSWTSFKEEREEIYRLLSEGDVKGVLLISGDRHFTGAYQVRGKWIEVTSGPIGSAPAVAKNTPEMFLNLSDTKGHFYCVYDLNTAASPPQVTLEIYRVGDGLAYRRAFSWAEVTGMTQIPPLPKESKAAPARPESGNTKARGKNGPSPE